MQILLTFNRAIISKYNISDAALRRTKQFARKGLRKMRQAETHRAEMMSVIRSCKTKHGMFDQSMHLFKYRHVTIVDFKIFFYDMSISEHCN